MTMPIIKTATESDEVPVIDALVLAFSMDPGARWTWPERRQYLTHFREFVKALGGRAFSHKSAYYLEGYGGVSLWLPPNVRPDEEAVTAAIGARSAPASSKAGHVCTGHSSNRSLTL
jgi:hypothetical protein